MVSITVIVTSFIVGLVAIPGLVWAFVWYKSFIHKVWIAKQSGLEPSDVVWVEDKFKVKQKDGYHIIIFKNHYSKSQSFPGEFWTKWLRNKTVKFDDKEWRDLDLKKHISRGLFLYQNAEGEFHPMKIGFNTADNKPGFSVLDQDNRAFIIRGFDDTNRLTLTGRKQLFAILAVIIAVVVLAICFILLLVYTTEHAANICGTAGNTFTETAQNVVGG